MTFTKLSILLLYKRIFVTGALSFSICLWTAGVITCLYPLTLAIGMANCKYLKTLWFIQNIC